MNNLKWDSFRPLVRPLLLASLAIALTLCLGQATQADASPAPAHLEITKSFGSQPALDGWILESGENSNVGGTLNSTSEYLRLGDSVAKKQYRGILSFNTAPLPNTAVITSLSLSLTVQGLHGTDPSNTWGGPIVGIRTPFFGTAASLQVSDFQAKSDHQAANGFSTVVGGLYTIVLNPGSYPFVNRTGTTQLRLRYALDDNNDQVADYIVFYTGEVSVPELRPHLNVGYHMP